MDIPETMYPLFELLILLAIVLGGLIASFIVHYNWGKFKSSKRYTKYEEVIKKYEQKQKPSK